MTVLKGTFKKKEKLLIASFSLSKEAIKRIEDEAERLDRSKSWVMNNLALNIKNNYKKG